MNSDLSTSGWTKLYHPRGPLVTLPVPTDPKEAFSHITRCLEVGWLVEAPGLGEGEHMDEVGYILRGEMESNGECTPYLLLYSTNEAHAFSFLKVYLNHPGDIAAFEHAAKMKLKELPEYAGNDKPERGKSAKLDQFIIRAKKPFGVVLKNNPKYNEAEREAALKRNEIYKTPRRLFVRWVDQATSGSDAPDQNPKPVHAPSTACDTSSSKPKGQKEPESPIGTTEAHTRILDAFRSAKTAELVEKWRKWADDGFDFSAAQKAEQLDFYLAAMKRLGMRKPAMAGK